MVCISSIPPPYNPGPMPGPRPPMPAQPVAPYHPQSSLPPQPGVPQPPKSSQTWVWAVIAIVVGGGLVGAIYLSKQSGHVPVNNPNINNNPPTAVLQSGNWGGNATRAVITLTILTARDVGGVDPGALKYIVSRSDNSPCYAGEARQNMTLCPGFVVDVAYLDTTTPGTISASDAIQISVTPGTGNPLVGGRATIQTSDDRIIAMATLN